MILILLVALLLGAQEKAKDQPYELKGETPGVTTLKQFKSDHRHADCSSLTVHQATCRVYEGVSFAGVIAHTYKGCVSLQCGAQGISANFVDGTLVYLSYGVTPFSSSEVIDALKKKFGEPSESTKDSATWKNSAGTLYVLLAAVPGNGGPEYTATVITSALNNSGQSSDI